MKAVYGLLHLQFAMFGLVYKSVLGRVFLCTKSAGKDENIRHFWPGLYTLIGDIWIQINGKRINMLNFNWTYLKAETQTSIRLASLLSWWTWFQIPCVDIILALWKHRRPIGYSLLYWWPRYGQWSCPAWHVAHCLCGCGCTTDTAWHITDRLAWTMLEHCTTLYTSAVPQQYWREIWRETCQDWE